MKTVTVDTATIAEAVSRAARVAPTKGAAYDKASGVLIEVRPESDSRLRIKATDLEVSYWQRVQVLEIGDEAVDWRFPAGILAGILAGFPTDSGSKTKFTQTDDSDDVIITCGRRKSRLRVIRDDFPKIKLFDPETLTPVSGFAKRISQVAWAVHPDSAPLSGVHIDGENLVACDRIRLVFMPCEVPLAEPVTVPLGPLVGLLKGANDVRVAADENRLMLMPDDDTQMTAIVYQSAYPNVGAIRRDEYRGEFTVKKSLFADALGGMLVLVKTERYPRVRLDITNDRLDLSMRVDEVGLMEDVLDIAGGELPDNPPFTIWFSPQNLLSAINNSVEDEVKIQYGPGDLAPVHVTDSSGYDCWLMPIKAS